MNHKMDRPNRTSSCSAGQLLTSLTLTLLLALFAWPARGVDTPWRLATDLGLAEYDAAMSSHAADGYRPVSVSARSTAAGVRFEAVWANDGLTDWDHIREADLATFDAWVAARRAAGYRVAVVTMYGSPIQYAGVVVQDPGADWRSATNRTLTQLSSLFSSYASQGYRMYTCAATDSGANARFSAAWTKDSLGWATNWSQSSTTFRNNAQNWKNQGGRLLRAAAYGTTTTPLFISTWVFKQQPDAWEDFLAQTAAEFAMTVNDMTTRSFRPIDVGAYDTTAGVRYNSTWVRQPIPRNWTETGREVPALDALDEMTREFMQARQAPAVSLSVTHQGRLVYSRAFTYAPEGYPITTPDSVFRIASVSKPILAVGLLRLVDQGLVRLDDKMVSILGGGWTDARVDNITVRDLLQHTGGWDRDITADPMFQRDVAIASALGVPLPISQQDIVQYQKGVALNHAPGTRFAYSNFGFMLAGHIIEHVTGQRYDDYMREHVFAVLGTDVPRLGDHLGSLPNEVLYSDPQQRRMPSVMDPLQPLVDYCYGGWNQANVASVGGVVCRTSDLVRFASAFDDLDDSPLLPRALIEEMWARPAYDLSGSPYWYGLGWGVQDTGNVMVYAAHDGALPGTMAWLSHRPDQITWAFVVNQNSLYTAGMPYNYDIWTQIDPILDTVTEWPAGDLWCTVDLNQDSFVDFLDYLEFLNLFDASDLAVDFTKDGLIDFSDYLEFLNLFEAGC